MLTVMTANLAKLVKSKSFVKQKHTKNLILFMLKFKTSINKKFNRYLASMYL